MAPQQLIEQGKELLAELDHLASQLQHGEQSINLDLDLDASQRHEKIFQRRQKVSARLQTVRDGWMARAGKALQELAPRPEPKAPTDPKLRYQREHELYGFGQEQRVEAFWNSVNTNDALTFHVVCDAAPYLQLMPPRVIEQVKQAWATRFNPHAGAEYVTLHTLWGQIHDAVVSLQRRVEGEPVGSK